MHLSIAILVYQFSPLKVVLELVRQARLMEINFEVIVYDDGSGTEWQRQLQRDLGDIPEVFLELAPKNLGRSAARNRLAQKLLGEFVLMIDGDNPIDKPHFVNDYFRMRKEFCVIVGGRECPEQPEPGAELRWTFTKFREIRDLEERELNPYGHFMTGCFFADRRVFDMVRFEEELKSYGYEDNLFGFALEKANIQILHIDNPQLFLANDGNLSFMAKSEQAMHSLYWIYQHQPQLRKHFKLLWALGLLKKTFLIKPAYTLLSAMQKGIRSNLDSNGPSLWRFDLFRLFHLIRLDLEH